MCRIFVTLLLLLSACLVHAQHEIKGIIIDENKQPVDNISLILYAKNSQTILAYTTTDRAGSFRLGFNSTADSLRLEISGLNYEKKQLALANVPSSSLNISVKNAINELREIVVKDPRPIVQKGDTINYNVNKFSDKTDRVIIDVIKKLPGIKVTETGQILYQNKAINKFYVDGKDLLENRYNIATNNLPVDAVDQVQLLENHQPIKMLNGIEPTERAAINIKLNENSKMKLLGNGNASLGVSPLLRNNNIALLKFDKEIQYIHTLKNNNIGVNLDNELIEQNFSPDLIQGGGQKRDLLSLIKTAPPPIDANRFSFNDNTLVNSNYLVGLNNLLNLKFNVAYENDHLKQINSTTTEIFLPSDTVRIHEAHDGKDVYHKLIGGLILDANTKKVYLKNELKYQQIWSRERDFIATGGLDQNLKNPFVNLVNDLNGIVNVNNELFGVNSYTTLSNLPQRLAVYPGQFSDVLNAGLPYEGMIQQAKQLNFYSNNRISFGKKIGIFNLNNKIGGLIKLQRLRNNLELLTDGFEKPAGEGFVNSINRSELKIYHEASLSLAQKKITAGLALHTNFDRLTNQERNGPMSANRLFFNPNLNMRYQINSFWLSSLSVFTNNSFSYQNNSSFILQSYRSLVSNDVPLYESDVAVLSYNLNYKNIINAIFGNFTLTYTKNTSNVLIETKYNDALITQTAISQKNPSSDFKIEANVNKYYLAIKTGIDLSTRYQVNVLKQLQQGVLTDFNNRTFTIGSVINTKVNKLLTFTHQFQVMRYRNATTQFGSTTKFDPIIFLNQHLTTNVFLPRDFVAKLNLEHYFNNSNHLNPIHYYFADVAFQKSLAKPKLDFGLRILNVFDAKTYTSYSYTNNYLTNSSYALRGRMVMAELAFQF